MKKLKHHFLSRRDFLKAAGVTLAGGALSVGAPHLLHSAQAHPGALPDHPNLLIIITDQERYPQHWPAGWDYEHNLPGRWQLAQNGITFRRAFCNSSMCSPSRANLFTGMYPAQHGLDRTLTYDGPHSPEERTLPLHLQNMARILATAGYHVALKGKWHLSKNSEGGEPGPSDVAEYGFQDWEQTSAGEAADPDDFGGGCANWDETIKNQAMTFLQSAAAHDPETPFALIVSLANPHDVLAYPKTWDSESETGCFNYRDDADFDQGISLPPTVDESLASKPDAQAVSRDLYAAVLGTLLTNGEKLNYVNFYAYLHRVVDQHIVDILTVLGDEGLTNDTIVVRLADHGEMGLSHGGLRQKMFNAYEETIHVPLVISNPVLFPSPVETDALASLVDVLPTLAALANVPNLERWIFPGYDLSPVLANPAAAVQDTILFTFDDDREGTGYEIPVLKDIPHHIQAIRVDDADGVWKYVRYYNPEGGVDEQYEMYHLSDGNGDPVDPNETDNLIDDPEWDGKQAALAQKLADVTAQRLFSLPKLYLPVAKRS